MSAVDVAVSTIAATQYGMFSREQAVVAGATSMIIRRRVQTSRWERVHPGVYRLAGVPRTWEGRALAACLVQPGTLASHLAAAHMWGCEGFPGLGVIDVVVPRWSRPRRIAGVRHHESLAFDLAGATVRRGIPVTSPARMVLDVCAVTDDFRALAALDEVRRLQLATWPELWECLVLHARRGRNGVARFRAAIHLRSGVHKRSK
jgi:hypothetical protein